jgi:hypothetical protein
MTDAPRVGIFIGPDDLVALDVEEQEDGLAAPGRIDAGPPKTLDLGQVSRSGLSSGRSGGEGGQNADAQPHDA